MYSVYYLEVDTIVFFVVFKDFYSTLISAFKLLILFFDYDFFYTYSLTLLYLDLFNEGVEGLLGFFIIFRTSSEVISLLSI